MSHYPTGGIGTTDEKIRNSPSEVLSFIRASQRGINYYAQNRAEAIDLVIKYIGIKDPTLAAEVYDLHASRLNTVGALDDAWMRGAIDFTRRSLPGAKEVAPNQVFNFSFVEKALARGKRDARSRTSPKGCSAARSRDERPSCAPAHGPRCGSSLRR